MPPKNKITHKFKCSQPILLQLLLLSMLSLFFSRTALGADSLPTSTYFGLDTMAPENSWAIRLEQRANSWDKQYDNDGDLKDLGTSFNGVNLNASLFPTLSFLGAGASLGTTKFSTSNKTQLSLLTIGYGLTPDVTIGAIIPYGKSQTHASLAVSDGNVGFNPAFDPATPIGLSNFPFAPTLAGVAPVGTSGVQQILNNPAFGYRYKPLRDTSREDFSDPTLGVLWRAYKTRKESLILGLGVRLGIAKKDDPDNLLDVPLGDGSTDLRWRLEYFRELNHGFDLHLLADYNLQTSDQAVMRIPGQGQILAPYSSKEKLRRDLGDFYETDVELGYHWSNWRVSGTWHRYEKEQDQYRSKVDTETASLPTHEPTNTA